MNILLDSQFGDLDHLATHTRGWDLDFRLTQKGGFSGQIRQVSLPHLLITYARFGSRLHQSGATPPGFRTFVVPTAACGPFWWLGYKVDNRSLLRFGPEKELAAVSNADFAVYTISLQDAYLGELAQTLGKPGVATGRGVIRLSATHMAHLRNQLQMATFNASETVRRTYAQHLAEGLVSACAVGEALPPPASRGRDGAVKRVLDFLADDPAVMPDIATLCGIAHVSERTLQYAFRERYGLSPNAFVRCWQLNSARRLLRCSGRDDIRIADVAAHCGFYDPSLFASHYRRMFDELPSTTLARATCGSGENRSTTN
jgi:AraC-like DNA-binding protein